MKIKLLLMLFFQSLLLHATSRIAYASPNSCMSVVLQEFYLNAKASEVSPCESQSNGRGAPSDGVFLLGESANISRDQLIGKKLKIGIPIKNGFNEFMKYDKNQQPQVTGFPIDVFNEVMKLLPYKIDYEFLPHNSGNGDAPDYYDDLISQVYYKKYDAVVGDTSATANRSDFVDFTYEYMDSGVSLIVPTEDDDTMSAWWFLKPLTTDLWLTTLAFTVLKGILIWVFEHESNQDFQGSASEIVGKILYYSLATFVFADTGNLKSNYSRFIQNLWTFLVFILVTAYGANLTSMLTVEKLQPTVTDLKTLIKNGDYVGYQKGSFVFGLLKKLGVNESKLIGYATVDEYADALSKGSSNGGVAAIMDEIPFIRVFLRSHCQKYTTVGPTYRTGGFAFVFPRGSAIVPDISRAVMNFTASDTMLEIENHWLGNLTTCPDPETSVTGTRLPLYSLRSIYIIVGGAAVIACSIYLIRFFYRRRKENALMQILQEIRLWMRIIAARARHIKPIRMLLPNATISPEQEASVESTIVGESQCDSCSVKIIPNVTEGEDNHSNGEGVTDTTGTHDLRLEMVPKKITRTRSRIKRNNTCRY